MGLPRSPVLAVFLSLFFSFGGVILQPRWPGRIADLADFNSLDRIGESGGQSMRLKRDITPRYRPMVPIMVLLALLFLLAASGSRLAQASTEAETWHLRTDD